MPWKVYEEDGKYCIHKLNDDGSQGELVKCHPNPDDAKEHMAALYANEPDAGKSIKAEGDRDKAEAAREARAKKYGIGVKDGGSVTKPSKFEGVADDDFGDPVNYAYPADAEHARAALGYFNHEGQREKGGYSAEEWAIVGKRLAERIGKHLPASYEYKDGKLQAKEGEKSAPDGFMKFVDGRDRVRAYAVLFGNKDLSDISLERDFFDAKTNFWLDKLPPPKPLTYDHGADLKMEGEVIGTIDRIGLDDWGVWYEAELRKAREYEDAIAEMMGYIKKLISDGVLRSSSEALPSYVVRERQDNGTHYVKAWPLALVSATTTPAEPRMIRNPLRVVKAYDLIGASPAVKSLIAESADSHGAAGGAAMAGADGAGEAKAGDTGSKSNKPIEENQEETMSEETKNEVKQMVQDLMKQEREVAEAKAVADQARKDEIAAAVTAAREEERKAVLAEVKKTQRLPFDTGEGGASDITVYSKWDGFNAGEIALAWMALKAQGHAPSSELIRALHAKAVKSIDSGEFAKNAVVRDAHGFIQKQHEPVADAQLARAIKAFDAGAIPDRRATKSDEVMYSTLPSYGNDWVPAFWSRELIGMVRNEAKVMKLFRVVDVPGESLTIPTVASKTTMYKTAQAANQAQLIVTTGALMTPVKLGTSSLTLTPLEGSVWTPWTRILDEDSIIAVLPTIQQEVQTDIQEQLDEILISGDTETGATNISDYGDGAISTSWHLLLVDGLRDYALNNSNTADCGVLTVEDFITVRKLLGTQGAFALDPNKLKWILDLGVYWKMLQLSEVLTRDKNPGATIENGELTRIWGSDVVTSDKYGLTDSSGHIHNTAGNNTVGSFLCVRPDRWFIGMGRNVEMSVIGPGDLISTISGTRHLVMTFRIDFKYSHEGASLGYNVTV